MLTVSVQRTSIKKKNTYQILVVADSYSDFAFDVLEQRLHESDWCFGSQCMTLKEIVLYT